MSDELACNRCCARLDNKVVKCNSCSLSFHKLCVSYQNESEVAKCHRCIIAVMFDGLGKLTNDIPTKFQEDFVKVMITIGKKVQISFINDEIKRSVVDKNENEYSSLTKDLCTFLSNYNSPDSSSSLSFATHPRPIPSPFLPSQSTPPPSTKPPSPPLPLFYSPAPTLSSIPSSFPSSFPHSHSIPPLLTQASSPSLRPSTIPSPI